MAVKIKIYQSLCVTGPEAKAALRDWAKTAPALKISFPHAPVPDLSMRDPLEVSVSYRGARLTGTAFVITKAPIVQRGVPFIQIVLTKGIALV